MSSVQTTKSCVCRRHSSVMLVTNYLQRSPSGGRELLCKLNFTVLKELYGDSLVTFHVPKRSQGNFHSLINMLKGYIDGLNAGNVNEAKSEIKKYRVQTVFIDGSNLGELAKAIKRDFPNVKVISFFHNVEARFFLGLFRETKQLRSLMVLAANYLAERKAVRYSDKLVCLSERDSFLLKEVYGRSGTHVSPMSLEDRYPEGDSLTSIRTQTEYALFVGGGFYANRAGIIWFVENVAPYINIKICIVGRGLEDLQSRFDEYEGVEVIGAVDSLTEWYMNAKFVVAPIFDGSGMKTKVAEALMYGKKIVGTPEAFSGYQEIAKHAGWICTNSFEFIKAINTAEGEVVNSFYLELRDIYKKRYSKSAAKLRMKEILS